MNSAYLLINIVVIIVPLILTFEKKMKFYKKLPAVAIAILLVGSIYIAWDVVATARGDWDFNSKYLTGFYVFNLPIEEVLFFITIPYAILFLFETAKFYLSDRVLVYNCRLYAFAGVFFIIASLNFTGQQYTMYTLFYFGLFFLIARLMNASILTSKIYWQFILLSFIPFFAVNYVLTSLPIVTYSSSAIWNIRITTIPVEDFFYSFSLLSFNILVYETVNEKWLSEN